ncbi:MAG: hypothetical protein ACTTJO_01510 [Metamycoplasmataceae bacterium]|uniref:hypothetical protein n=1 Tax=Mycoplasmopsis lipophila TaxID=2117 RepID=UPI003873155E
MNIKTFKSESSFLFTTEWIKKNTTKNLDEVENYLNNLEQWLQNFYWVKNKKLLE